MSHRVSDERRIDPTRAWLVLPVPTKGRLPTLARVRFFYRTICIPPISKDYPQ